MSGHGHLRNFVTSRGTGDSDRLVQRVTDGITSNKYKKVNYDELKALAAAKKFEGHEKLIKVKKLQHVSQQSKEQSLLKQHKMVWQKEFLKLNSQRKRTQAEVDFHIKMCSDNDIVEQLYSDLQDFDSVLEEDFGQFKKNTVDPIWELRDDLLYWTEQYRGTGVAPEDPKQVKGQVKLVQDQQKQILLKLKNEQISLEKDLQIGELPDLDTVYDKTVPNIVTGIPEEAFNLECPDLDLKASVLEEFILLDGRYMEKLEGLEDEHSSVISTPTGGWSPKDHFVFQYVLEQYTFDLQNRRLLYIDMMRKHLSHKTRAEIVAHEEWWTFYQHFYRRKRALIIDWIRDRTELMNKVKVTFAELVASANLKQTINESHQKQKELCQHLYRQVCEWREQKEEAMRLEAEIEESKKLEKMERMQADEEREKKRRQQEKDKINMFHDKLEAERRLKAEEDRKKLEILKKQLAEQAEFDKERIRFREDELKKKREVKQKLEEERRLQEEEKERVLEALREKVRPHVEGDLLRLWSETETAKAHRKAKEEYISIQKPLYEVNTFNSKQVMSDPRSRFLQELANAGIADTVHARQAMSQLAPLQPPRRDMESTVFKQ